MIKKSFICSGIIYDNNQEQELYIVWKKIQNKIPIIENDLADDYKQIETIEENMKLDI